MFLTENIAAFPGYTFFVATAALTVLSFAIWSILSIRGSSVPKGLRRPPSPPGARLLSGHSHLWSGNCTSKPYQSQLVKLSQEYGEIYEIRLGVERWVVVSSPEAVKVSRVAEDATMHSYQALLTLIFFSRRKFSTSKVLRHPADLACEWLWTFSQVVIGCSSW